jgi:transposase
MINGRVKRLQRQIRQLKRENDTLREENICLKKENQALKEKIAHGEKSSSRQARKNTYRESTHRNQKKPGRRRGHRGTSRKIPQHYDQTVEVTLPSCPHCGTPLGTPVEERVRYVEDIEPPRPRVTRYRISRYYCPTCKKNVSSSPPDFIPHCMLGIKVMLFVVYQRYALHLPYNKIRDNLEHCFGIKTTDATLFNAVKLISFYYRGEFLKIKHQLRSCPSVHIDETGWRINGVNHWLWTFISDSAAIFTIDKRRSGKVPREVLGDDYQGVVISDFYSAYSTLPYKKQKCLIHLLRETKKVSSKNVQTKRFHRRIKRFVHDAARFIEEDPSPPERKDAYTRFYRRLERIMKEPYTDPDCLRLVKRLKKHRNSLLTFLEVESVDYHNNTAERALRSSVVMRKITGGNRSQTGADTHEILMSMCETCKMHNENFLEESTRFMRTQLKKGVTSET